MEFLLSRSNYFRPFSAEEIAGDDFLNLLGSQINMRQERLERLVGFVGSRLREGPSAESLPLDIGEAVAKIYERYPPGGKSHVVDSITGGVWTPVNERVEVPRTAKPFHCKKISPQEVREFPDTYGMLLERLRALRPRAAFRTPVPLGSHVTASGVAYAVRTWVAASSYSEIMRLLNPANPFSFPSRQSGAIQNFNFL